MTSPLYSDLSPNLLAQFSRQNTPHGLFGSGNWRAPQSPGVSDTAQQGGFYGGLLNAPRPTYSSAQQAELPNIVNAPNVTQEAALAALQALTNSPTPNPVSATGPGGGAPPPAPTVGDGQSFSDIQQGLAGNGLFAGGTGGGYGGGQPSAPSAPASPSGVSSSLLDYYDQIGKLPGGRGHNGGGGIIDGHRLWDVSGDGNYLVMDQASNPVFGSADELKSRSAVAQWLAEQGAGVGV